MSCRRASVDLDTLVDAWHLMGMPGATKLQARSRRGTVHLACVTALAGWLALSNVLTYFHEAVTAHRRCAEHGELVHVASADALRTEAPATPPNSEVLSSATAAAEHDDAHCTLCPSSCSPVTAAVTVCPELTICRALEAAPAVTRHVGRRHGWLIRIAPKTSPPAPRQA
jgi:hypothetical protein